MEIKISKKDIIWSYTSQIFQIGSNLFLLPILLKKLSSEYIGIWYIFLSIGTLIQLLDLGLQPTISRNIAYLFSGSQNLLKEGIVEVEKNTEINYKLLFSLIHTCKSIYRKISIIILFCLIFIGTPYIYLVTSRLENTYEIFISWVIYSLALVFNFYYYYYTPLLMGSGKIKEANKTLVYSRVFYLIIAYVGISFNFGFIAIPLSFLFSSLVNRITSHNYFWVKELKEKYLKRNFMHDKDKKIKEVLWHNSKKMGISSLGAFLSNRGITILMSLTLSLEIVAIYNITLQIVKLIRTFSEQIFNVLLPKFNELQIKNKSKFKELYSKNIVVTYLIYICSAIIVISFGNDLLIIFKSQTNLLKRSLLVFLFIVEFLRMNHSISANLLTTKNIIPFFIPSIVTGILVYGLTFISVFILKKGVFFIIFSNFLINILYENWKWPNLLLKDLETNFISIIKLGIKLNINDFKLLFKLNERKGLK